MATKKTTVAEVAKPAPESEKCPMCVNGRIPQQVAWHYVSCEVCKGTAMK